MAVAVKRIVSEIQDEVIGDLIASRQTAVVITTNGYQNIGQILDHDHSVIKM